jgi:hypothetical protein
VLRANCLGDGVKLSFAKSKLLSHIQRLRAHQPFMSRVVKESPDRLNHGPGSYIVRLLRQSALDPFRRVPRPADLKQVFGPAEFQAALSFKLLQKFCGELRPSSLVRNLQFLECKPDVMPEEWLRLIHCFESLR